MSSGQRDNQHYTPRLLLKGFTMRNKPKMTFRYKKGERTKEKSIRRIASDDKFYMAEDGDNSVDERNTEYENAELKQVIEDLRSNAEFGAVIIDQRKVERAILHLWARSRNFRDSLSDPIGQFFKESLGIFGTKDGLENLFTGKQSAKIEDKMYSKFVELMPTMALLPKAHVLVLLKQLFSKNPNIFEQMALETQKGLSTAMHSIQPSVKAEHINFMSKNPKIPTDRFEGYSWFLLEAPQQNVVFPDCVLMGYDAYQGFRPLILVNKETNIIALPISTSRLLIGTKGKDCPELADEHIQNIGRCAYSFFIFPKKCPSLEAAKLRIGEYYSEFSNDVVESTLSDYR